MPLAFSPLILPQKNAEGWARRLLYGMISKTTPPPWAPPVAVVP